MIDDAQGFRERMACLADESRFRIVLALAGAEQCVSELARTVGLSQSCTTRHLQSLARRGLVQGSRRGRQVVFALCFDTQEIRLVLRAFDPPTTNGGLSGALVHTDRTSAAPREGSPAFRATTATSSTSVPSSRPGSFPSPVAPPKQGVPRKRSVPDRLAASGSPAPEQRPASAAPKPSGSAADLGLPAPIALDMNHPEADDLAVPCESDPVSHDSSPVTPRRGDLEDYLL